MIVTLKRLDEIEARAVAAMPTRGPEFAETCWGALPVLAASYREAVWLLELSLNQSACLAHYRTDGALCNCGLAERRQFLEGVRRKE